ncbi:MAG: DUF2147 domain-containing protein [Gammaproteobacteria bacterium]|nr:DUF2147 domain-containing protein [Gammaproteobacteria bacterium]
MMKIRVSRMLLAAAAFAVAPNAPADVSPAGRWKVVSDQTNRPVAIMHVFEQDGEYRGYIEQLLERPGDAAVSICERCPGELKGQPIEGLVILHGLTGSGGEFSGGHILDPDSGHYYRVKMTVGPEGQTLKVRGYLGISLLGRTQTWYRAD